MTGEVMAETTPEDVRHEMVHTRADLAEKAHALEDRVVGVAHDAVAAVEQTADDVMEAVQGVADSVRATAAAARGAAVSVGRVFDVRAHLRRHPWFAVGTAVAVGFACGRLTEGR